MPGFIERHGLVRWTKGIGARYPRDGSCEVCGVTAADLQARYSAAGYTETARRHFTRLVFDHCHEHGWVRGLLCLPCNNDLAILERGQRGGELPSIGTRPLLLLIAHYRKCPDCQVPGQR